MSQLTLVGTPIGNLEDFSPRGVRALREADFIAAEDTRVSIKLLNHFEIKAPMISYHEHNRRERGPQIISRILAGESCVLITDAGMPAISDPGEDLVNLCHRHGVPVVLVPGPTAAISALAASGLPGGRFTFEGFLPVKKRDRTERLQELAGETRTMIFYEAPHKLRSTLSDLTATFGGERQLTICRELTKLHEEIRLTTLGQASELYTSAEPRGEFVLVVAGGEKIADSDPVSLEEATQLVLRLTEEGLGLSEAAKAVAKDTGHPKGELYRRAIHGDQD